MNKLNFTPGPWKATIYSGAYDQPVITHNGEGFIARVHSFDNRQHEANAKLIAKAPEMYEALKEISEGKGRYNPDQLIHASNTIEDMKEIALTIIKQLEE